MRCTMMQRLFGSLAQKKDAVEGLLVGGKLVHMKDVRDAILRVIAVKQRAVSKAHVQTADVAAKTVTKR